MKNIIVTISNIVLNVFSLLVLFSPFIAIGYLLYFSYSNSYFELFYTILTLICLVFVVAASFAFSLAFGGGVKRG